jgi:hypothetical protein
MYFYVMLYSTKVNSTVAYMHMITVQKISNPY